MVSSDVVGVFGANSFLGRYVVRSLAQDGIPVVAFGRKFSDDFRAFVGLPIEIRIVDFEDELETHASLQGITHVVQLVNTSNPAMANKRVVADLQQNVIPHVSFIESCISSSVKNFVFISSGGTVYGIPDQKPIAESHPSNPLNSYGMAKRIVEKYLVMLSRGTHLGYSVLRVSNLFGPGQTALKGQGLIPTILYRNAHDLPVTVFGNGRSERDYIYIDDVAEAIKVATVSKPLNDIVNIGSGEGRTILDIIEAIEQCVGRPVKFAYADERPTDSPSNVLDVRKAKALIGWEPRTDFAEGMRRTVEAFTASLSGST